MIVTVEPGLYLPLSEDVPREFRGIAIRIEDNLFLTEDAPLVLADLQPAANWVAEFGSLRQFDVICILNFQVDELSGPSPQP